MKSLTFSCLICALNRGATKPIFCSKVAQKGKICSRLLEPQKVAPNVKSCSKELGKAYPLVRPSMGYKNLFLSYKHFFLLKSPIGS